MTNLKKRLFNNGKSADTNCQSSADMKDESSKINLISIYGKCIACIKCTSKYT